MRGSRARMLMTMRAAVTRNATVATDVDGQLQAPNWQALATIACRVFSKSRKEIVDGRIVAEHEELFCAVALDADITEADRIDTIQNRLGASVFIGPFAIDAIQNKISYKQAKLRVVTS